MGYKTALRALFLTSVLGLSIAKSLPYNPHDRVCVEVRKSVLSPLDLRVYVTVQPVEVMQKFTCYADVHAKPNAINMRISSILRLDDENILLVKEDEFERGVLEVTFISITQEYCELSPLKQNHKFYPGKNGTQKELDITFEAPLSNENSTSLEFDWHQKGVRVNVVPDNKLLLQFHDAAGTLKVRLYKSSSSFIELLSMKSAADIDIVSANLTFCWVRHPGEDNVVTCSKFNKYGKLDYRHTVVFPENINIQSIENTKFGEIILSTRGLDCQPENCKIIYVSVLSKNTNSLLLRCAHHSLYKCLDRKVTDFKQFNIKQGLSFSFTCNNGTIKNHFNKLDSCSEIGTEFGFPLLKQPNVEPTREEKQALLFLFLLGGIINVMDTSQDVNN